MKIAVISYSLTGNNEALADSVAKELSAERIKVIEPKARTTGSIMSDLTFNKTPQVQPNPDALEAYDLLLFFGPVWIGQVATPLRAYLKYLKANPRKYAFISISGGALGPNPKLAAELQKRTGSAPVSLIDLHIADLLPCEPKPVLKDTQAYRIKSTDVVKLTNAILNTVREAV